MDDMWKYNLWTKNCKLITWIFLSWLRNLPFCVHHDWSNFTLRQCAGRKHRARTRARTFTSNFDYSGIGHAAPSVCAPRVWESNRRHPASGHRKNEQFDFPQSEPQSNRDPAAGNWPFVPPSSSLHQSQQNFAAAATTMRAEEIKVVVGTMII